MVSNLQKKRTLSRFWLVSILTFTVLCMLPVGHLSASANAAQVIEEEEALPTTMAEVESYLKKRIPDGQRTIASFRGEFHKESVTHRMKVNGPSDLQLYVGLLGNFQAVDIYRPNGSLLRSETNFAVGEPIRVLKAEQGTWKVKLKPYSKPRGKCKYLLIIKAVPTSPDLKLPTYTQQSGLSLPVSLAANDRLEIRHNGQTSSFTKGAASRHATLTLSEGRNDLELKVTRDKHSSKTKKYRIILDTQAPQFTFDQAVDQPISVDGDTYTLSGEVSRDSKSVTLDGADLEVDEYEFTFRQTVELMASRTELVFQASDRAGNTTEKIIILVKK